MPGPIALAQVSTFPRDGARLRDDAEDRMFSDFKLEISFLL